MTAHQLGLFDTHPRYRVWHVATDGTRTLLDHTFKSRYAAEYAGGTNVDKYGGSYEVEPVTDQIGQIGEA